jgi:ADP-ribose pyrophosphatase YjhB (NUDIX family)
MKTLLRTNTHIPWMPENSEARLYQTHELPPTQLCGTAFAFAFLDDRMLMTRLANRGWDIPGGHLEPGESPDQAAIRETLEETQVVVELLELVGIQELEVFDPLQRAGWSRPLSVQLFYRCQVVEILPFHPTAEAVGRDFLPPDVVRTLPTMVNHDLLYEIALRKIHEHYSGT